MFGFSVCESKQAKYYNNTGQNIFMFFKKLLIFLLWNVRMSGQMTMHLQNASDLALFHFFCCYL